MYVVDVVYVISVLSVLYVCELCTLCLVCHVMYFKYVMCVMHVMCVMYVSRFVSVCLCLFVSLSVSILSLSVSVSSCLFLSPLSHGGARTSGAWSLAVPRFLSHFQRRGWKLIVFGTVNCGGQVSICQTFFFSRVVSSCARGLVPLHEEAFQHRLSVRRVNRPEMETEDKAEMQYMCDCVPLESRNADG